MYVLMRYGNVLRVIYSSEELQVLSYFIAYNFILLKFLNIKLSYACLINEFLHIEIPGSESAPSKNR